MLNENIQVFLTLKCPPPPWGEEWFSNFLEWCPVAVAPPALVPWWGKATTLGPKYNWLKTPGQSCICIWVWLWISVCVCCELNLYWLLLVDFFLCICGQFCCGYVKNLLWSIMKWICSWFGEDLSGLIARTLTATEHLLSEKERSYQCQLCRYYAITYKEGADISLSKSN